MILIYILLNIYNKIEIPIHSFMSMKNPLTYRNIDGNVNMTTEI